MVEAELGILPGRCRGEPLIVEAERGTPEAGHRIDIGLPGIIEDTDPLPACDDQRPVLLEALGVGLRMQMRGNIAAGNLAEAIEQADRLSLDEMFPAKKNCFALRVRGDSMIEAAIADGDIVICKKTKVAHKGDIVVALTDEGEATLKYWFPEANRIRLQPANSSMKPIYARDVQVLGIVQGVIRKVS